ncbi:MAG TPA: 16S rRNA (guanine(966)-N(2))-methyltransferase RsmD [Anaerolineaceae bacterium]
MSTPRIISGKARGIRLRDVPGDITRPITDRVKEALFNILGGDIVGTSMLDLFGGTGSVGIEALSRGAAHVHFVDLHRAAIATIKTNLDLTGLAANAAVTQADAFNLLNRPPSTAYDYIYVAPPQYKELWQRALLILDENPAWLASDGWIIVQIAPVEYHEIPLKNFIEFDQRRYGSTLLVFYEKCVMNPSSEVNH